MTPQEPTSSSAPGPRARHTAEERALAAQLARLGPHSEPSPQLDARILAAAQAAANRSGRNRRESQRLHWPLQLGLAASLVLALGLAWQLRPLPNAAPAYRSEAERALPAMTSSPARSNEMSQSAGSRMEAETDGRGQAGDDANVEFDARSRANARSQTGSALAFPTEGPASRNEPKQVAEAATPGPQAPIVLDAPTAVTPPPQAVAAPPAPPPAERFGNAAKAAMDSSQKPTAFGVQSNDNDATAAPAAAAQRQPTSSQFNRTGSAGTLDVLDEDTPSDAMSNGGMREDGVPMDDMPAEDVPPATVATPAVRDAWLARIRELADQGLIDQARDNLQVFRARYPRYPLPEDLRALDAPAPAR